MSAQFATIVMAMMNAKVNALHAKVDGLLAIERDVNLHVHVTKIADDKWVASIENGETEKTVTESGTLHQMCTRTRDVIRSDREDKDKKATYTVHCEDPLAADELLRYLREQLGPEHGTCVFTQA